MRRFSIAFIIPKPFMEVIPYYCLSAIIKLLSDDIQDEFFIINNSNKKKHFILSKNLNVFEFSSKVNPYFQGFSFSIIDNLKKNISLVIVKSLISKFELNFALIV